MGMTSMRGAEAFGTLLADVRAQREAGLSRVEETRQRLGNPCGRRLLELWHGHLERLCDRLDARDPAERLTWAGPDMSVRMFATARPLEVWAPAQAIWDGLAQIGRASWRERGCEDA